MSLNPPLESAVAETSEASPGLLRRTVMVFANPARAWTGLESRVQWWFPMLVVAIVSSIAMLAVYERSYLPMMTEGIERQVADGQISQQQLDRAEAFFTSPMGKAFNVGIQFVGAVIVTFLMGLVYWLAGGFILGRPFGYRLGLEVASWAGLIALPAFLLRDVLAYLQGVALREVHVGLGILIPDPETPSRLVTGLRVFLDEVGPLGIWYVVVGVIGLSALSGATRKATAWVLAGLYVALQALLGVIAGLASHGA